MSSVAVGVSLDDPIDDAWAVVVVVDVAVVVVLVVAVVAMVLRISFKVVEKVV